ncbi:MAG: hypothetical protein WBO92_01450 [Candidatus Moraniibacteriota bacterium]
MILFMYYEKTEGAYYSSSLLSVIESRQTAAHQMSVAHLPDAAILA